MLWVTIVVILQGVVWLTGEPDYVLAQAVEDGAERVEQQQLGEESEDVVRKAIQLQRDTLPFWTLLTALRDFVCVPLWLGLRALGLTILLSAAAAATGRPTRFGETLYDCVAWQGVWVLGVAVQVLLMLALQRSYVSTSLLLFQPQSSLTAVRWVFLEQLDCFAAVGWLGMLWSAWRRGQNLFLATLACGLLASLELIVCFMASLAVNLSMRMALVPH